MKTIVPLIAFGLASLITASIAIEGDARADDYPSGQVKIINPYPAGGPGDVISRILAQKLSEDTGGRFYVENLPGAGGTIGAGAAAKAAADGRTILMVNQDFIVQALVKSKIPYDPFNGFAPIGLVATAPEMISVHPSVPAKNMEELLALLKANPGKYSYATPGYGTSPHLACERLFRISYGLDVVAVPFQGAAPAVQSTMAGHTQIIHVIAPAVSPYIKHGALRALAVASKARAPAFPDVPTLEESGVPNREVSFWMGGVVPVGTPKPIIELLHAAFARAMELPEVRQRLAELDFEPAVSTPDKFAAHMRTQWETWKPVVQEANIKVE